MRVHVCVWVCVVFRVYTSVSECVRVFVCVQMLRVCKCVGLYVCCAYECVYECVHECVCTSVCTSTSVYVYTKVCSSMYEGVHHVCVFIHHVCAHLACVHSVCAHTSCVCASCAYSAFVSASCVCLAIVCVCNV